MKYRDYMVWIYEDFEQGNAGGQCIKVKHLLDEHYPAWREARAELNGLPLAAEKWRE